MNAELEEIFTTGKFVNQRGETVKVHSETNREQCRYLQKIIEDHGFRKSVEIGFAYGTSTLAIVESIARADGHHVVIDKFQHSSWGGNGLDLVEKAGFRERVTFHEEFCYIMLPSLLERKMSFDFAYIDSTKQFDWLLVDFFYLDLMLDVNGVIVFDDVTFPSIRKLLRFLSQYPHYRVHSQFPRNSLAKKWVRAAGKLGRLPHAEKLLRNEILRTDTELGVNAHAVALQKTGPDERRWDWHAPF